MTYAGEIAQFVADQYDEEQQLAEVIDESVRAAHPATGWTPSVVDPYGYLNASIAEYIETHSPARVLADIASKRRILARHARCANGEGCCSGRTVGREYCDDIADLAAPYANRPGFKPKWRLDS